MPLTREELEARRLNAAAEITHRGDQSRVARQLGVSRTSVCRWVRAMREGGGTAALARRKTPGRPMRLTPDEIAELRQIYQAHPNVTQGEFTELIRRKFNVHYNPDHVGRIIHRRLERTSPQAQTAESSQQSLPHPEEERN